VKPYIIKQGDYLLKVAHLLGFDPDQVWNDGKNAELKKLRKDPKMLVAGDVLFVPDEPKKGLQLNAKQANAFVAKVPVVKSKIVIAVNGKPWANEKYVIEGLGDDTELKTTDKGEVTVEVPVHVREVAVRFPDRKRRIKIAIGHLDPPDTPSGARMRLTSLGLYAAKMKGADPYVAHDEDALKRAVAKFQKKNGLEQTGEIDDKTKQLLVKAHGS
jgi:putative peptidoglycan binding protein